MGVQRWEAVETAELDQSLADLVLIFVLYNLARRPYTHFWFSKVLEAQIKIYVYGTSSDFS